MSVEHYSLVLHDLRFDNAQIVPLCKRVIQFLAEHQIYCHHLFVDPLDKREIRKSYPKILAHLDQYQELDQAIKCYFGCFAQPKYQARNNSYIALGGFNNGTAHKKYQQVISITQPRLHLDILRPTFEQIDRAAWVHLFQELVLELRPRYGYCTLTDSAFGYFAACMGQTPDQEEKSRNSEWFRAPDYQAWNQGYLRSLYPGNYLNEEQLARYVTEQTLAEWIHADRARGTLTPLTPDLWYWQIDPELIPPVRAILDAVQITFKRDYVLPRAALETKPATQAETLQFLLDNNLIARDALVVCIDHATRQELTKSHSLEEVAKIAFTPQEIINATNAIKPPSPA